MGSALCVEGAVGESAIFLSVAVSEWDRFRGGAAERGVDGVASAGAGKLRYPGEETEHCSVEERNGRDEYDL